MNNYRRKVRPCSEKEGCGLFGFNLWVQFLGCSGAQGQFEEDKQGLVTLPAASCCWKKGHLGRVNLAYCLPPGFPPKLPNNLQNNPPCAQLIIKISKSSMGPDGHTIVQFHLISRVKNFQKCYISKPSTLRCYSHKDYNPALN